VNRGLGHHSGVRGEEEWRLPAQRAHGRTDTHQQSEAGTSHHAAELREGLY